jgi:hypothetical protein
LPLLLLLPLLLPLGCHPEPIRASCGWCEGSASAFAFAFAVAVAFAFAYVAAASSPRGHEGQAGRLCCCRCFNFAFALPVCPILAEAHTSTFELSRFSIYSSK